MVTQQKKNFKSCSISGFVFDLYVYLSVCLGSSLILSCFSFLKTLEHYECKRPYGTRIGNMFIFILNGHGRNIFKRFSKPENGFIVLFIETYSVVQINGFLRLYPIVTLVS